MNLEQARFNMVEQQIRPWETLDQDVQDLLYTVKREEFVPPAYRSLAFADAEIPLDAGKSAHAVMLSPKIEARALQALQVRKSDKVLEIGTGSGYMAALLAVHADRVWSIEIVPELAEIARGNLARQNTSRVVVETGDAAAGWPAHAPYDVILVSGSLPILPKQLLAELKIGGRLFAIVGEAPVMTATLVTRIAEDSYRSEDLFETLAPSLVNAQRPDRFVF